MKKLLLTLVIALFVFATKAQTLYWNGATPTGTTASGGSGTWNTTTTNWLTAASSGTITAWPSGGGDIASFGTPAGTVTVGANVSATGIAFTKTGYTISGSSTISLTGTPTIAISTFTETINAPVSTSTGLLTITGGSGPTLNLGGANSIGSGGMTVATTGGGALNISGNNTFTGAFNDNGTGGNTATISGNNTFNSTISITATGGSTTTFSGANTFSGLITVSATGSPVVNFSGANNFSGGLKISTNAARINGNILGAFGTTGNAGTITIDAVGGILTNAGSGTSGAGNTILNNIDLNPSNAANFTAALGGTNSSGFKLNYAGVIASDVSSVNNTNIYLGSGVGTGSSGAGITIFSGGSNTYHGKTIFNASQNGLFQCGATNCLPTNTALVYGNAGTSQTYGVLDLNNFDLGVGSLETNLGTTPGVTYGITNSSLTAHTLTINGGSIATASATFAGVIGTNTNTVITGTNNINLALASSNTGSLTLTGVNTYTGTTTISGGSLFVNNASGLASGSAVTVNTGGTLGGNGKAAGTVAISGTMSPGASGAASVANFTTGAQTWYAGATYTVDISALTGTAGANWDLLTSTGAITLPASGNVTINVTSTASGFSNSTGYSWKILTGASVANFNASNFTINTTGFTGSTGTFSVTNPNSTDIVLVYTPATPTLTANGSAGINLSGFSTTSGVASASQSFIFAGSSLNSSNIVLTAPSGYEISTDNTTFNGSVTLVSGTTVTYNSPTLSNTTIYVRITNSAALGSEAGSVTITGGGATAPGVALSGFVVANQPTSQATNVLLSSVAASSFVVNWTNGDGANRIVVVRPAAAANVVPSNGTDFTGTANLNVTSAGITGASNYVVYAGSGSGPITVTGLTGSTNYSIEVYEYNGSTTTTNYLTTTAAGNPNTQLTAAPVYYWNGGTPTAGSNVTAAGGTGTWTTANAWVEPQNPGIGGNWVDGNAAIVAGTAGTISITTNTTVNPTSTEFQTSGYVLTSSGTTTSTITGSISLDPSVSLTINDPAATSNRTLATGSITGGTGLTIAGAQTSGNNSRLNLAQTNATISVPVNINGTGSATAYAGIVGTATGTSVTGNITNNGTEPTMIGATSGSSLLISGNIDGTAGVIFAAGTSGGSGTITLSGSNTYSGITNLNNTTSGVVKCGATNTLSPNSVLNLGFSGGNGSPVDLNGFDQTIKGLSSGAGTGSIINSASGTGTSTLTVAQTSNTTFGLVIADGATAKTAVVKSGSGTLTLTGANTFTGGLTLSGGIVQMGAAANLLANNLPFTFNGGSFGTGASAGYNEAIGTLLLTDNSTILLGTGSHNLKFNNSSLLNWTAGKVLTVTGWVGTPGNSGTSGQIFVGTDNTGLTSAQLAQITFTGNNPGAIILSTGEIVPASANLVVDQTGFNGSFGNIDLGSASGTQSFTVSGASLDPTVVITPPAGYQLSLTSGSGYQTSALTLNTTGGVLGTTTIYVEFIPTTIGNDNGNITVVSGSASQNVAVTGTGVLTAVYSQASGKAGSDAIWAVSPVGTAVTIASLGGFNKTTNVIIQNGHIVTTSASQEITAKDLTINSGGALKELVTGSATPYYINLYGDLTVDGQLGALAGADSLGLNAEGVTDLIQGSGTINLQRIRKSTNTNVTTTLTIDANVNLWWPATAIYNNFSGTSTFNVTVNSGATVNLQGKGDISIDGTDGTGAGSRTGIITVNGTITGADTLYASTNNTSAGSIGFSIGNGGLISANRVMTKIGGTGTFAFNVQAGGKLDIYKALELQSGTFAPAGTVTFKSTSNINIAYLDNFSTGFTGTYSGQLTAERYYDASETYNQHYFGSPVHSPSLSQFGASGSAGYVSDPTCDETRLAGNSNYGTVFALNESNGTVCAMNQWDVLTSGNATDGQGYSVVKSGTGTLSLTGAPNLASSYTLSNLTNSGWSNITLQLHTYYAGWQLVSNPYLATIQITAANSGFDNQIQVWNTTGPFAGSYQPSNIIAPFQAFMVHKTNAGSGGTYTINASSRVITPQMFFDQSAEQLNMVVTNTSTGLADQTTVGFSQQATDTFDAQIDGDKIPGALSRHTIYSVNSGKWMSKNILNSILTTSTVPVGFEAGATGTYTLAFNGINTFDPTSYIYLEDRATNTMVNSRNGNYTFAADSSDSRERFVLHFTPPVQIATVEATCNAPGIITIQQPGTASWSYTLTDANNAIVTSGSLNQSQPVSVGASAGTYTLTLTDASNYSVIKSITVNGPETMSAAFNMSTTEVQTQQPVTLTATTQGAASYLWNLGNGTTETGANITVNYAQPGVYNLILTVTNTAGCSASTSKTITVNGATGLANVTASENVAIWSHDNTIFVDFDQKQQTDAKVIIYDVLGQELSNEHYTGNNIYQKEINGVDIAYLIVMVKTSDKISTKKVFITNSK